MILNGILLIHNQEANLIRTSFLFSEHISPKHSGSIVSGHAPLFQLESEFPSIGTSQQPMNRILSNQFSFSLGSSKFSTRFYLKLLSRTFTFSLTCNFGNRIWSDTWKHSLTITSL